MLICLASYAAFVYFSGAFISSAVGFDDSKRVIPAKEYVNEALRSESKGGDRATMAALQSDEVAPEELEPVHWMRGEIKV